MSTAPDDASAFITELLRDSALAGYTPLQKEEQILQFLAQDDARLQQTLSHSGRFPDKSPAEARALLENVLVQIIDNEVIPDLRALLVDTLDFSFVHALGSSDVSPERISEQVYDLLTEVLKHPVGRRALAGPYTAVHAGIPLRYLTEICAREGYTYFELTTVQRLRMDAGELAGMVGTVTLLSPTVHVVEEADASEGPEGFLSAGAAEATFAGLARRLDLLPEQVIRSAVNANVSFLEHRFVEPAARLAAIFARRGRSRRAGIRADEGAKAPEASWFSIARRNHTFYGFDVEMLQELYRIAAHNGW